MHVEGEMEWVFQRFYDFQADGLIRFNIVTLKRSDGADWRAALTSTLLRPQLQKELVDALSSTGFGEILSFGSLGGDPFDPLNSGNLVLTAIKI